MALSEAPQRVYKKRRRFWPFGPAPTFDSQITPLGYEQITFSATGQPTHLRKIPPGCDRFMLNVETSSIRYLDNGDDTTTGYGMLFVAGTSMFIVSDPRFVSLCADTAVATVNVLYYRGGDGAQHE